MNLSAKVKDVRDCVIKKVVPVTVAVAGAANALMISAFATGEDASGGLDTTAITTSMQSSLKDLILKNVSHLFHRFTLFPIIVGENIC